MNAQPVRSRASLWRRTRTMMRLGVSMMFFDKAKLVGTILGVVFAVVLTNQQLGIFLGLLDRNEMFVAHAGADIWILPPSTKSLAPGRTVSVSALHAATTTDGVAWAEPLLYGGASVKTPAGGSEQVTLIGTKAPRYRGGPWNIVAGDASSIERPDTMTFETSERETLGGINLGSVREVNGRRMTAGAFTWGLEPFGPSYAFTDYETARELLRTPSDETSYVLVGVDRGRDVDAVKKELIAKIPGVKVMTTDDFVSSIGHFIIFEQSLGTSFGASTAFGIIVGFVIVALSMFSSVVDNIREFGTLKAIGAKTSDLALLLLAQSIAYACIGTLVGLALVGQMGALIRSPRLTLITPPWLTFGTIGLMVVVCISASVLALLRIRKVEPAMVFR